MSDAVQVLGSVTAVLLAFGLGWQFRNLQLWRKRAKMRRRRAANERRKRKGQPKLGVNQTKGMRKEMQHVLPWGPFPSPRLAAGMKDWRERRQAGYKLSMTAGEWLSDEPEEELKVNELPADELAKWRGNRVTRNPYAPKKLDDHEIMQALLDKHDSDDDGAQDR